MADYDSSLPIRTENDGDVVINISDPNTPANKVAVENDGSINVNTSLPAGTKVEITDGTDDLAINADGSINVVATATDLDIRDLAFATDSVDVSGSDVTATVSATDLDIRDLSASQDNVAISDGTDTLAVNADGSINSVVSATDLDIRDLSAASDSVAAHLFDESGVAFSSSNPLPVEFFESKAESFDFHEGDSIAKNATTTHTFAAPADFKLKDVFVSGSGKLRAQLSINSVIVAVGFNSTANPQVTWKFQKGLNASSVNVTVLIENLDNQPQNLYSTIVGIA